MLGKKVIVQWGSGVLEGSDSVVPLNGAPLNFFGNWFYRATGPRLQKPSPLKHGELCR